MVKLIWLSDLHFVAEGLVQGHDPRMRLQKAVEHINTYHDDSDYCVVSGDLVDRGTGDDYRAVRAGLDKLSMPRLPMVGNHDDRVRIKELLPVPEGGMTDFVQYAVQIDETLLVCLDTLTPGAGSGSFCEARLAWLDQCLSAHSDVPALIFMHHPPMPLGLPMQDQDRLLDGEALLSLLARHDNVRQLCIGHVHRPVAGSVRGLPFATMRAVLYQAPPPVPAWDWDSFEPAIEAPALGVIRIENGDVLIQYEQFCDAG